MSSQTNNTTTNEIDTAALRIGNKIRKIRLSRNMTLSELANAVGLTADRVFKYETGFRKPKDELLLKFANALKVDILALKDPILSNPLSAMYALFELEENYGMEITEHIVDGEVVPALQLRGPSLLNTYMRLWAEECRFINKHLSGGLSIETASSLEESYREWKRSFPKYLKENQRILEKQKEKEAIAKQIAELQKKYEELDWSYPNYE